MTLREMAEQAAREVDAKIWSLPSSSRQSRSALIADAIVRVALKPADHAIEGALEHLELSTTSRQRMDIYESARAFAEDYK